MNWLNEHINTIIHGDSCKLIKLIPDKSIDLIITDPQGFVNDGDEVFHPTQKPLRLMSMIIQRYAEKGDLIGDFYSGSGTVCVAAKEAGYSFIGIEKDEHFYKKSIDRINGITATGQTSIFTDFGGLK